MTLDTRRIGGFDHLVQEIVGRAPLEQGIRRQRHAVPQRRQGDALDVIGRHVGTAVEERHRPGAAHERQGAARPAAHGDTGPAPRRPHDAHGVVDHLAVHPLA
jgi:hypothetical protein